MRVCIYVCVCKYTCMYVCVHLGLFLPACMHMYEPTHAVSIHTHMVTCAHVYSVYVRAGLDRCVHVHTHPYVYTHMCLHGCSTHAYRYIHGVRTYIVRMCFLASVISSWICVCAHVHVRMCAFSFACFQEHESDSGLCERTCLCFCAPIYVHMHVQICTCVCFCVHPRIRRNV